jgi:hypothetical protein
VAQVLTCTKSFRLQPEKNKQTQVEQVSTCSSPSGFNLKKQKRSNVQGIQNLQPAGD